MSEAHAAAAVLELTEKRTFRMRLHDRTLDDMELVGEWEGFAKLVHPCSGFHLIVLMAESRIVSGTPCLIADIGIAAPAIPAGLKPGETYIGILHDAAGKPLHHVVLLPGEAEDVNWIGAVSWAGLIGGVLPSRQEQRLLFEKAKGQFKPRWYWSGEQHASVSGCAWGQYFDDGDQYGHDKSYGGRARAVRRLPI